MPRRRTVEEAIRLEWSLADKAVKAAQTRLEAIQVTRNAAVRAYADQELAVGKAIERRTRAIASLEALLGRKIKEDDDGESAAPAATGANAEVQPDGKDAKK